VHLRLLESGLERWRTRHVARRARAIIRTIDAARFTAIRARYRDADPDPGSSKYLDLETWVPMAVGRAHAMNLHRSRGCDVLDLGTGCGYFPLVCRHYGHRPITLDLESDSLYNEMIEFLGIDRRPFAIRAGMPLPVFETRFDWVTAFMICFNNHARRDLWGPAEWEFFVRDVVDHVLKPGGRLFLEFNPEPDGRYMSPQIERVFARAGASVRGNLVMLAANARG
jgi:SAM-dependent methyltransferase